MVAADRRMLKIAVTYAQKLLATDDSLSGVSERVSKLSRTGEPVAVAANQTDLKKRVDMCNPRRSGRHDCATVENERHEKNNLDEAHSEKTWQVA